MKILFSLVSFSFSAKGYKAEEKAEILSKLERCLNTPNLHSYEKIANELKQHPKFGPYFLKNWDM